MAPKASSRKRPAAAALQEETALLPYKKPQWVKEKEESKGKEEEVDTSANTRAQQHVFQGMLPRLEPELQQEWNALCKRKGERGIQALKNAFRNKLVKKDCDYQLDLANLKEYKVAEVISVSKKSSVGVKEKGVSWSTMRRLYHYNDEEIEKAKDRQDIWEEEGSDGETYWFERTKQRARKEETNISRNFHAEDTIDDGKTRAMLKDTLQSNKGWLFSALKDKKSESSKGPTSHDRQEVMKALQQAWDASTSLTADAGMLANRVMNDDGEIGKAMDIAKKSFEILRSLAQPSQKILDLLAYTYDQVDFRAGQIALETAAARFMELEKNHQDLILSTKNYSKKTRSKALDRLKQISK